MSTLKHLLYTFATFLGTACTPQLNASDLADWNQELTYSYLDEDEADGKLALKYARRVFDYTSYYARLKLGNLAIVQGITPAPAHVTDANGNSGYIAVILGNKPCVRPLPNDPLLIQYLTQVRIHPEALSLERRLHLLHILSDMPEALSQNDLDQYRQNISQDLQAPLWLDQNGVLTVEYISTQAQGMMAPYLVRCKLTFQEEPTYTSECVRLFDE